MGKICPGIVITQADRRGKSKAVQPGNREQVIAIITINGEGESIPPFLIVQGVNYLANQYSETTLPYDWVIKPTNNSWTDNEAGLDWLKHFDKYTTTQAKGPYRILVLDGYKSYKSVEFQEYYKSHNIITLGLPPHSSHLTQPLNVGCFSILKRIYGRQIKGFIKAYINYITKVEFFLAFKQVYQQSITIANSQAGFRGAGLIPFLPETVLGRLDIKLRTPTPIAPPSTDANPWVSQTPYNPADTLSQTTLVRDRIARY